MSQASLPVARPDADKRRARYALMLAFVLAFSSYKAAMIGFGRVEELWLNCVFDASIWALGWLVSELVVRRPPFGSERVTSGVYYTLLYGSGVLVFAHTSLYDSASQRRLTVLEITFQGIATFFAELPAGAYVGMVALIVGVHVLAFGLFKGLTRPRLSRALAVVLVLCVASLISAAAVPRTPPTALYDNSYGLWQFLRAPSVHATPLAKDAAQHNRLDKNAVTALPTPRFNKVVVLVMETTTLERFDRDLKDVPSDGFFRNRKHVHTYSRYFPNNQDSRTGMLAMLTSRVIPYEAYVEANVEAYTKVSRTETLIDRMRQLGYRSAFALAQVVPEEIVCDLPWDKIVSLPAQDIPTHKKKYLCLVPDPWETSCEDLVMIPHVVDFLAESDRSFVYQEFIWGHAIEYNQMSGKSNGQFYSHYVDTLIAALKQRGMLDDTLIVVTSDHGYRGMAVQDQLKEYQMPMWVYATRFSAREDARLLSHVDFKDILFDELGETNRFVTPNEHVFVQGPTGSGMTAAISERGVLTLIKRRDSSHRLLARKPEGEPDALLPGQLLYLFQRHKESFDRTLRMAQ